MFDAGVGPDAGRGACHFVDLKNKHDIDARCSDYFDAGFAPQNILAKFVGTHASGRKNQILERQNRIQNRTLFDVVLERFLRRLVKSSGPGSDQNASEIERS